MSTVPWLSLMIFLPLLGVLILFSVRGSSEVMAHNARWVALWSSGMTFLISIYILFYFDSNTASFQFVEQISWLSALNITYFVGVDGISLPFVLLSTFLTPLAILISWEAIKTRVPEFMAAFLLLESFMLGMFCALDFVLFYIFFEGVLIPMFLIIGVWGGQRRIYSAFKFFLYTLLGSVLMLVALLYIYFDMGSASIPMAMKHLFSPDLQKWLWLAFFASFAVKIPMWPVHTWLPDAHVEAPTAGSVILAGVLLKMGGYGFLRFSIPMFPEATLFFMPLVFGLSLVAIVYASFVALVQKDIKKLIAYSSVAHMGFVTLGLFALTPQSVGGAVFQMISHGLISGALFLCIGMVYERLHTRDMGALGGLVTPMPKYAFFLMVFILGSVGLPGTSGFVGEFLVLLGAFSVNPWISLAAASGMVLGAAYGLWFYRQIMFGKLNDMIPATLKDLNPREILILTPLLIGVIGFGIYPAPILNMIAPAVENALAPYERIKRRPPQAQLRWLEPKRDVYSLQIQKDFSLPPLLQTLNSNCNNTFYGGLGVFSL
ncbi:MAG: NADH-quinone oxidoreductase subunit M [Alphaproteobacteria bacterium]